MDFPTNPMSTGLLRVPQITQICIMVYFHCYMIFLMPSMAQSHIGVLFPGFMGLVRF